MSLRALDVELIHRAFSPAQEIHDPEMFVGRRDEIESGISAMMNPGGFLVIYGLRGVGKSSIAYQLALIAQGHDEVPRRLGIRKSMPHKGFHYLMHYIRCDGYVSNIEDLVKRIIFGDEQNPSLFSLTSSGDRQLTEFRRTVETEGSGSFFGARLGAKGKEEKTYRSYISDDLVQQFRQLLGTLRKDNRKNSGVLILIDEFDTIPDKTGFASIVKACSSDFVKFGVIGIATNISEFVYDHGSISRQVDLIKVPLMPESDLERILRQAEFRVRNAITFDDSARTMICQRSEGFPYFTHLLGKEAMLRAFRRDSPRVVKEDIERLAEDVSGGRLSTIYENTYHAAVKNSHQRELLLKAFAEVTADEIGTEPVYTLAKELGVSNPSQLMKELTAPEEGAPVLTKVRDRYYRFTDPVFKAYARIRSWKLQ